MNINDRIITNQSSTMINELKGQKGVIAKITPMTIHGPQNVLKYCVKLDKPVSNGVATIHSIGLERHQIEGFCPPSKNVDDFLRESR